MTYVTGFLTPVKTEDKARYVKSAEASWPLFQKYGACRRSRPGARTCRTAS